MSSLRRITRTQRLRLTQVGVREAETEVVELLLLARLLLLAEAPRPVMSPLPLSKRSSWGGGSADQASSGAEKSWAYCQPASASTPGCVTSSVQSDL